MRVLVLSDLWVPFPGGAERLMFNLARELDRQHGVDVAVVTGYHPAERFDGPLVLPAVEIPENAKGGRRLGKIIRDQSPDVILTHHYWALTFEDEIASAAHDVATPVVQVVLNGRRLATASFAVFISNFVRDQPGMAARNTDLTLRPLAFAEDVDSVTHEHAIGFIKPIEHKGVDLVYAIAERMPSERFVILRGEWQDIEKIRDDLPNVEYLEPVLDMRDFYRRVDRVIVPSLSEDAGTVAQECTVNGIPCISSDVGGLRETNAGGVRVIDASVPNWIHAIEALDDRSIYDAVVATMRNQNPTTQPEALAQFVARVRELGS